MSDEKKVYKGIARGGPYDGLELESRFPCGVLFVDKPTETGVFYLWDDDKGEFEFEADIAGSRPMVKQSRQALADGNQFDVRARIEGRPW